MSCLKTAQEERRLPYSFKQELKEELIKQIALLKIINTESVTMAISTAVINYNNIQELDKRNNNNAIFMDSNLEEHTSIETAESTTTSTDSSTLLSINQQTLVGNKKRGFFTDPSTEKQQSKRTNVLEKIGEDLLKPKASVVSSSLPPSR